MSTAGLVASYGADDSDDDDSMMNESNHIDRQKLTCNLCERKFNSTAVLEKHVKMSDLHKVLYTKLYSLCSTSVTDRLMHTKCLMLFTAKPDEVKRKDSESSHKPV